MAHVDCRLDWIEKYLADITPPLDLSESVSRKEICLECGQQQQHYASI